MGDGGRILAVIPARGGSKGLPGKNVRAFAGLPLIAHSILLAKRCPEIGRCVVSTDSEEIAEVARQFGAEVPFTRPPELARDDSPLWEVLRHALGAAGQGEELLLLLDPTSPAREPADVAKAMQLLRGRPEADGVIAVSKPDFNPIWHCVVEQDGWMKDFDAAGGAYARRQDVPPVYRINGSLYLWRTPFVRAQSEATWRRGKHLMLQTPESRAMSIDTLEQFARAELLVKHGFIPLAWLHEAASVR
jgi:N-acylneuraminate cytidylyltransferase